MKKHPWACFTVILIVTGLVIGLSAADLWQYIIDFMRIGIDLFVTWIDEVIRALRDSITSVTNNADSGPASDVIIATSSAVNSIIHNV